MGNHDKSIKIYMQCENTNNCYFICKKREKLKIAAPKKKTGQANHCPFGGEPYANKMI